MRWQTKKTNLHLMNSYASNYSSSKFSDVLQNLCRDGVSEGQFYQVLLYELDAIRKVG